MGGRSCLAGPAPVPYPKSYWVVPRKLLAGEYPGSLDAAAMQRKLGALLDAGVTDFIDLTEADEETWEGPLAPYADTARALAAMRGKAVRWGRFPIRDMGVTTAASMAGILDAIDRALGDGGAVYVHCLGGIGRTGTVVGCWLVRGGRAEPAGAIAAISALRAAVPGAAGRSSPETTPQRAMVESWRKGR